MHEMKVKSGKREKKEGAGGAPCVEWEQEPARGTDHAFAIFNSSFTDKFDSEVA